MRACACGARDTRCAPVEVNVASDEMHRRVLPGMRNGVRLPLDFERLCALKPIVSKLLKQRKQPLLSRDGGRAFTGLQLLRSRLKRGPHTNQVVPSAARRFVEFLRAR